MAQYLLPLLAGLSHHVPPVADRTTAVICLKAAELARERPLAQICLAAGRRPHDGVSGQRVMHGFLTQAGVPPRQLSLLETKGCSFRTLGEMQAFARMLHAEAKLSRTPPQNEVAVIARWWHLPRACLLLRKQLGGLARYTRIELVGLPDWTLYDLCVYEPAAWVRNARQMF